MSGSLSDLIWLMCVCVVWRLAFDLEPFSVSVVTKHTCLCRHWQGSVHVGLADGTLAVLDACDSGAGPRQSVAVGTGPVRSCVCVLGQLWVGCEGSIHQLDLQTYSLKVCT